MAPKALIASVKLVNPKEYTGSHHIRRRHLLVDLSEYSSATIAHRVEPDDLSTMPQLSKLSQPHQSYSCKLPVDSPDHERCVEQFHMSQSETAVQIL